MAAKTKKLRAQGQPETQVKGVCNRCGQTEGYVWKHNHDYSHPYRFLEELCMMCHQVHHAEIYASNACEEYWAWIKQGNKSIPLRGTQVPECYAILRRKFGIFRPRGFGKIKPPQDVLELYNDDGFRKKDDQLSLLD
jgi:hypothetical protein